MKKNNLDERQEQALLKIEHNGCWLAFWALLAAMTVQMVMTPNSEMMRAVAGEWIVFMALSLYMVVACLKNGIWDRRLKADGKTNFLASLIAGVACGAISFVAGLSHTEASEFAVLWGAISGISGFVLCFIVLSLLARVYKKRRSSLEQEPNDDEE